MKHVFIVAEIGCNHNGSKDLAREMVIKAKECGVDAVKFQTFKADALISCYAPKAEYQKETTGTVESQLEMTKKLELSHDDLIELKAYAESLGLVVFSTPFDLDSVDFLNSIGQSLWKIPSGEITNLPYLKIGAIKIDNKKIILSSGMATIDEIKTCIGVLVEAGTNENDIILLHCNTEYPTPDKDVNILAINDLKEQFPNVSIGFSDHSVGRIEVMAGSSKKIVTESERKNKIVARKSIVAARNIVKGEILTEENITCKRPGNGISPMKWYDILGKVAEKDFRTDELIEQSGFEWQEC